MVVKTLTFLGVINDMQSVLVVDGNAAEQYCFCKLWSHLEQQFHGHYAGWVVLPGTPVKIARIFLKFSCYCWQQPMHSDWGKGVRILNDVMYAVSITYRNDVA